MFLALECASACAEAKADAAAAAPPGKLMIFGKRARWMLRLVRACVGRLAQVDGPHLHTISSVLVASRAWRGCGQFVIIGNRDGAINMCLRGECSGCKWFKILMSGK